MKKETAKSLLTNNDNILIVLDSFEGVDKDILINKYNKIINRKLDNRYTKEELQRWKQFYLDAFKVQIINSFK